MELKDKLLELENRFWQAIQDKDIETATGLTDFPCLIAGAQGVMSVSKEQFEGMMKSENYTLERFELKDAEVRPLAEGVAALVYTVKEKLTVDGKAIDLDASESSVWIQRDGEWRCGLHSESLLGDSYGRDKLPTKSEAA